MVGSSTLPRSSTPSQDRKSNRAKGFDAAAWHSAAAGMCWMGDIPTAILSTYTTPDGSKFASAHTKLQSLKVSRL